MKRAVIGAVLAAGLCAAPAAAHADPDPARVQECNNLYASLMQFKSYAMGGWNPTNAITSIQAQIDKECQGIPMPDEPQPQPPVQTDPNTHMPVWHPPTQQ